MNVEYKKETNSLLWKLESKRDYNFMSEIFQECNLNLWEQRDFMKGVENEI